MVVTAGKAIKRRHQDFFIDTPREKAFLRGVVHCAQPHGAQRVNNGRACFDINFDQIKGEKQRERDK